MHSVIGVFFCTFPCSKMQTIGAAHIRAEKALHLMTRSLLSGGGLGGNAIGRDDGKRVANRT
jgi:hypothetical protein